MNSKLTKYFILVCILIIGCDRTDNNTEVIYQESFEISVTNNSTIERKDEAVYLILSEVRAKHPEFNPNAFVILSDGKELASQTNDLNGDGKTDQIVFISDYAAKKQKTITIRYLKSGTKKREYPKKTQAELSHKVGGRFVNRKYKGGQFKNVQYLRVPDEHTDHSEFIRYEGPGWESDKVGYRFYLDWRNAIDVFGKKTPEMVLHKVGLDGFDSYHEMSDWGMDILKVGESLGIGSLGMWFDEKVERVSVTDSITCEIIANGPVQSRIQTRYYGWKVGTEKYDLISDLSITAGSRLTKHVVRINGDPPNLCTGIVKSENVTLHSSTDQNHHWMYFATYGNQSLAGDKLGLAILFHRKDLIKITGGQFSYVILLKPENLTLTYYLLAAWEQEPGGIKTEEKFIDYLNETIIKLEAELIPEYK